MFRDSTSNKDFFELNDLFRQLTGNRTGLAFLQKQSTVQLPQETIQQVETLLNHVKNLKKLFNELDVHKIQVKLREIDHAIEAIKQSKHYINLEPFVKKTQAIIKHFQHDPQFIFVKRKEHLDNFIAEEKEHHFRLLLKNDIIPLIQQTEKKINAEKASCFPFLRSNKIVDTHTTKKLKPNHAQSVKAAMQILELLSRTIQNRRINPIFALDKMLNILPPAIETLNLTGHADKIIKTLSELHAHLLRYQKKFPDKLIELNNKIDEHINQQINQEFREFLETNEGKYIKTQQILYGKQPLSSLAEARQTLRTTLSEESHNKLKHFDFRELSKHETLAAMLPKREFDSFMRNLISRELLEKQILEQGREKNNKQYRQNAL